ncbi:hypothetical protein TYRP_009714 [Tyrophagus putrescentiae]|nr:hypothetical protein TYRP_009714 [Tyrophagus putrescentiae]
MTLIIIFTSSLLFSAAQLSPAVCLELPKAPPPPSPPPPPQFCQLPAVNTTGEMDYVMKHIRKSVLTFKVDTSHANLHVDDTAINSYGSILATGPPCTTVHSHSHHHQPPLVPHHLINHPITRTAFSVELRNVSVTAQLTFNAFFQKFHGSYESRFAVIRLSGVLEADLLEQRLELDSFRIEQKTIERENFHFKGSALTL